MTIWTLLGGALTPVLKAASAVAPKPGPKPVRLPRSLPVPTDTTRKEIDSIVEALDARKGDWVRLSTSERAALLKACVTSVVAEYSNIAEVSTTLKGSWGQGIGEEGNNVLACVLAIQDYYGAMRAGGQPKPLQLTTRADGQQVAQVFPQGLLGVLFPAFKGEVWLQPGQRPTQGKIYRDKAAGRYGTGTVSLVLGAGNQLVVLVCDVLHKLFAEDEVVVLKINPVAAALGPPLRAALAPLVQAGYLTLVYGGKEAAEQLINHPKVGTIHLTGSADTYNSIVWGSPTAPRTGRPVVSKPLTAELGCITPHIIVPGTWTQEEMEHQASNVVAGLSHNSGHNCLAIEVIVTCKDWPQREAFLKVLRGKLDASQQRKPWYPGSDAKHAAFLERFPQAHKLGVSAPGGPGGSPGTLPWLLAEGVAPADASLTENWCGVMQEVPLPGCGASPAAFMEAAEKFANDALCGSLSCGVVIDPRTQREHAAAFDNLISRLRYGLVGVNVLPMMGFTFSTLTWGAYPGNTAQDIGSGVGFVHNAALFDNAQKSVLWGNWMFHPTPFWWNSHRNLEATVPYAVQFARYMYSPLLALWYVTLTALAAIRG